MTRLASVAVALFVALAAPVARAEARPVSSADETVAQAKALGLARTAGWRRLLLYRHHRDGWSSDVDGPGFFLAPRGKVDPEAELEATVRGAFALRAAGEDDLHAICRFPARMRWLDAQLHFLSALPLQPRCAMLERYVAEMDVSGVSFVFASSFVENPPSAFGHTLLRIAKKGSAGPDDARDHGVDYTAEVDTRHPLTYAVKGIAGLFPGIFRFRSYAFMLREYGVEASRDMWEYELALDAGELSMLVLHLWELDRARIDYLYMTENCSYQILAALDAAAPRLGLLDRTRAIVLPIDTLKTVTDTPGLVRSVRFRPSQRTRLRAAPESVVDDPARQPHRSHDPLRLLVGTGMTDPTDTGFATVGFRFAYHDLADPPRGVPELLQLQVLDGRLRYDYGRRVLTLDTLTFVEVENLRPLRSFDVAPSWRLRAFGTRLHDRAASDTFGHGADGAMGVTIATSDERLAAFAMADAYVAFASGMDGIDGSPVRVGVGPMAGVRAHLFGDTVALARGTFSYLPVQDLTTTFDVRASLRTGLGRHVAMGLEGTLQPRAREISLLSYVYF